MTSTTIVCDLADLRAALLPLFEEEWSMSITTASSAYDNLKRHCQQLKENVHFVIETSYVDKVYRDSYYAYFSTKFNQYKKDCMSKGLHIDQIAFALKEFGLATRIYSKYKFGTIPFKRLLSSYVESGLPLLAIMTNNANVTHSLLLVGRTPVSDRQLHELKASQEFNASLKQIISQRNITFFDNDDILKQFVFIDDNMSPYQIQDFDTPGLHYNNPDWATCEITHFIVPLYSKVYLEAEQAKECIKILLLNEVFTDERNVELFLRVFLTSSRSYKDYLSKLDGCNTASWDLIMRTSMPKFIWVGEISYKTQILNNQACGLFIIDATEPNYKNYNALIIGGYKDNIYVLDSSTNQLIIKPYPFGLFTIYTYNLKEF